jgi:hypothetical protein
MNAIRQFRSAVRPSLVVANDCRVVRLCPPSVRIALACRWRQEPDGRLTCIWQREPLASMTFDPEQMQNCHLDGLTERHACQVLA